MPGLRRSTGCCARCTAGSGRTRAERGGEPDIGAEHAAGARLPEAAAIETRGQARELLAGVGHVERLVLEDSREQVAGLRIAVEHLCINGESPRRRLLRQMQESEQRFVALALDAEVVQAALARSEPVHLQRLPAAAAPEQRAA